MLLVSPRNLRLIQRAWSICSDSSISTLMALSISKGVQAVPLESFNLLKSLETRLVLSILFILRKFCQIFIMVPLFSFSFLHNYVNINLHCNKEKKSIVFAFNTKIGNTGYFCKCKKKKHSRRNFCWGYSATSSIAPLFLSQSCYFTQPRLSSDFRIQCNKLMLLAK